MSRYLAFSENQQKRSPNPLEDFSLTTAELLPEYFGIVANINIFLGENNSGKSRFMREVMRSGEMRAVTVNNEFFTIKSDLLSLEKSIRDYKFKFGINMVFNVDRPYEFRNQNDIADIFSVRNDGNGASVIISVADCFDKIDSLSTDIRSRIENIKLFVKMMFEKETSQILEKITNLLKELARIGRIFSSIDSREILGKNFHHRHANYGHTAAFGFAGGYLVFDRYTWGDEYNEEKRNEFSERASDFVYNIYSVLNSVKESISQKLASIVSPENRTYIPILRTARTLITQEGNRLETANDIFLHTTLHDYDLKETGVTINTGFSLYDAIDTTRNARHGGRTSFKAFEDFLSATFFNGKTVEVVAERVAGARGGNIIMAVEGVERDIHDLGDGIQSIIMLLYPLFIAPEKAWFFIEEPELHLHPGFQRLFIETITTNLILRAKSLTIFLTTHSNHILDFALDDPSHVNIFTFRRREGIGNKSTYQIQLSSQRDIDNLNVLGVRNSSVFLANCSIWVEGISDRIYFRAYLHAYLEYLAEREENKQIVSLLEGLHYAFLEYAGGNISHFDFTTQPGAFTTQTLENIKALSISNRVMLVADLDDGKNTRHEARDSQQHSGFQYVVLTVKEVENMLSPQLIAKGLKKLFRNRDFDPAILTQTEYRTHYLGSHLQDKYGGFPASFLGGSGTIGSGYKRSLAEAIATPKLKWEEMSRAAQKFTETLYQFIINHNPRLGSN